MATQPLEYEPAALEKRWQARWRENRTFEAPGTSDKPPFYVLSMFPYPSGAGMHLGHHENYTAADILTRYKRARGFHVTQPMGWDAFGLPTEQNAVKTGRHPVETTRSNVENIKKQMDAVGWALDWSREVNTTDPAYFRWTQWIFLHLFKEGLAYVDERPVWWCPALKTVLANEEVIDGKSERGNHPVERRALRQWVLRITAYAEKLLEGLEGLDWPDSTKRQQRAWIGKSEGAHVTFALDGRPHDSLEVFTTRPDTLYGVTYMVLAPEHPLVDKITTPEHREAIEAYKKKAAAKSDLDRTDLAKEKSGVFTGAFAVNPLSGRKVPVWVADYVLMGYGTGAIMAVPAHDERDYEFAREYDIPVVQVIEKPHGEGNGQATELPYPGKGVMVYSDDFSGLDSEEGARRITEHLEKTGKGKQAVNYKLRDWLFSRQRYWGEPFPLVWVSHADYEKASAHPNSAVGRMLPKEAITFVEEGEARYALPLPPEALPLELPEVENYEPSGTGESPLAKVPEWLEVWFHLETGETRPRSGPYPGEGWAPARRETNTMPQWAGSCWYYLRYMDPGNATAPVGKEAEAYWQHPHIYIGGAEHAVLHLLYARFWHRFLHDQGLVTTKEPFPRLIHQGIILGEDGNKMSKSLGNFVDPQIFLDQYGVDALRLHIMFMGPLEDKKPWNTNGIEGIQRFLRRSWRELTGGKVSADYREDEATERLLHETIAKVTADMEALRYNTAISALMVLMNHLQKAEAIAADTAKAFVRMLAPLAPHLGEELWERLGGAAPVCDAGWPEWDEKKLKRDEVKVILQVNGKVRGEAMVPAEADEDTVMAAAKADERVSAHLEGKTVRKVIFVPGKILNVVAN